MLLKTLMLKKRVSGLDGRGTKRKSNAQESDFPVEHSSTHQECFTPPEYFQEERIGVLKTESGERLEEPARTEPATSSECSLKERIVPTDSQSVPLSLLHVRSLERLTDQESVPNSDSPEAIQKELSECSVPFPNMLIKNFRDR